MDNFTQSLLMLNEIVSETTLSLNRDEVLRTLLNGSIELLSANCGAIIFHDGKSQKCITSKNMSPDILTSYAFAKNITSPLRIRDISTVPEISKTLKKAGVKSALFIPIDITGNEPTCLGIFTFSEREFSDNEMHVMEILVSAVRSSIKNSMLFDMVTKSQKLWLDTFDGIKDFLFVVDENDRIIKTNKAFAEFAGRHPREIIGETTYKIFDVTRNSLDSINDLLNNPDGEATTEVTINGETYLSSGFPIITEDGTTATVHIMKNMTDIKKLREQLYHTDKLSSLGMLVSGVAHEINNPLTGILGYTELLQMKTEDGVLTKELNKIHASAERCKAIVENLLTFSRQKPPERSFENINEILDKTIELRIHWLRSNDITVEKNYSDVPFTMLDPQQIQQVILNILINAEFAISSAHNKNQGHILFSTKFKTSSNMIIIEITDNGTGINSAQLNKIFDPFFTTKPVDKGTGLGLSISHGIIKEHGGEIMVKSLKDEYTTFIVNLPVIQSVR